METNKNILGKLSLLFKKINTFEGQYNFLKSHNPQDVYLKYYAQSGEIVYTYGDFLNKVDSLATFLEKQLSKFSKESWIGIKIINHPLYSALCFALLKIGFNVVFIDNKATKETCEGIIKNAGLVAIISSSQCNFDLTMVIDFEAAVSENTIKPLQSTKFANKIAFCTSGTTGQTGICVYDGSQLSSQIMALFTLVNNSFVAKMLVDTKMNILIFLPLHHIFGFILNLAYSIIGLTIVMCEKGTLTSFISAIKNGNVQVVFSVPMIWETLMKFMKGKYAEVGLDNFREVLGNHLKLCISGGARTPHEVIKFFNDFDIVFSEGFGLSEAGMLMMNMNEDKQKRLNGSIGNIMSNPIYEMKVLSDNGKMSSSGIGELIISGRGLSNSILADGTEVHDAYRKIESFLKTGDLVEVINNEVYIRDRIKDIIINSSGENICPSELEKNFEFLCADVQFTILGIDDLPVIIIVLPVEKNNENYQKTLKEKIIFTNKNLPLHKKIVFLYFTTEPLPLTSALKVKKAHLRDLIKNNSENYKKTNLINIVKPSFEITEIKKDLKKFFSEHLNIDINSISDNTLIIEELNINSVIMAEIFVHIEEKYKIKIDENFIIKDSLSISDIVSMIYAETQKP